MKMVYEKPNAEIILFDNSDVITTSGSDKKCGFLGFGYEVTCNGGVNRTWDDWWKNTSGDTCTGELHKTTSGKCYWVNGTFSIGDDEDVW